MLVLVKNLDRVVRVQLIKMWSDKDLLELVTTELVGVRAKHQTKRGNQRKYKAWRDKEVKQAIDECQKALKAHRKIKD